MDSSSVNFVPAGAWGHDSEGFIALVLGGFIVERFKPFDSFSDFAGGFAVLVGAFAGYGMFASGHFMPIWLWDSSSVMRSLRRRSSSLIDSICFWIVLFIGSNPVGGGLVGVIDFDSKAGVAVADVAEVCAGEYFCGCMILPVGFKVTEAKVE